MNDLLVPWHVWVGRNLGHKLVHKPPQDSEESCIVASSKWSYWPSVSTSKWW